ncbi:MAG: folate-binding protein YgfZ [Frankiales bacterium]|nr:folate-binding protein YgfZ [Frankiales bacterium]
MRFDEGVNPVPADAPDSAVAGHYGDPYAEQRLLARGEGAVDLSQRPVLRITGPDRLSWLHSLLSQHVAQLQPGESTEALVLSPQGHVEHHLHLLETGDEVLAHVEPGTAEDLTAFLDKMRFMLRVEVTLADDLAVRWHPGPVDGPATRTGFGSYALVPRTSEYDGPWAGVMAHEALRVAARRARLGMDTDHRTLPHEVGWLSSAVHLDKGCYRGQESVARIYNLGRPPRRLVLLHLDGSDSELPAVGDPVLLGDREVGRLGSRVRHHELGPIALALVKRNVPDDAQLVVGGVTAAIDPAEQDDVPESPARAAAAARATLLRLPR